MIYVKRILCVNNSVEKQLLVFIIVITTTNRECHQPRVIGTAIVRDGARLIHSGLQVTLYTQHT